MEATIYENYIRQKSRKRRLSKTFVICSIKHVGYPGFTHQLLNEHKREGDSLKNRQNKADIKE